jgi:hypothetical protein
MLSQEENELFTLVGPETPAGQLLSAIGTSSRQPTNSVT